MKGIDFVESANDIVQVDIKPDFQVLGQKFGKDMKNVLSSINSVEKSVLLDIVENRRTNQEIANNIFVGYDDFILEETPNEGFEVSSNSTFKVGIMTEITKALKHEGIVRDLIRSIQNFRKELDFNVSDRINIGLECSDEIVAAIENHKEYFLNEVLGVSIALGEKTLKYEKFIDISNQKLKLSLSKDRVE